VFLTVPEPVPRDGNLCITAATPTDRSQQPGPWEQLCADSKVNRTRIHKFLTIAHTSGKVLSEESDSGLDLTSAFVHPSLCGDNPGEFLGLQKDRIATRQRAVSGVRAGREALQPERDGFVDGDGRTNCPGGDQRVHGSDLAFLAGGEADRATGRRGDDRREKDESVID